jgi:ABC-type transporter Mla subunit MlaD
VPERKTRTRSTATRRSSGAARDTPDALGRLSDSIEAAQAALKDLRAEMPRGSRDLVKDVDRTLRDARKNLRRTSRRIATDLDEVQQATRGRRTAGAPKAPSSRATTRRRSTGESASIAGDRVPRERQTAS